MFIQVIEGRVADAAGLDAALERWRQEIRPGAIGFLGSTLGYTDDGRFIGMARFDSAEAARANSERPEQAAWWSETERCFDGPVTFHDCTEVDVFGQGGTDQAGFVQVMQGHGDRSKLQRLDSEFAEVVAQVRPDLLGSVRAWDGDEYTEAAYFTSESEARAAESKPSPPAMQESLDEWQSAMGEVEYYDLTPPHLTLVS